MQKNKVLLKKKKYHQIPTKSPDSKALQQKKNSATNVAKCQIGQKSRLK